MTLCYTPTITPILNGKGSSNWGFFFGFFLTGQCTKKEKLFLFVCFKLFCCVYVFSFVVVFGCFYIIIVELRRSIPSVSFKVSRAFKYS